MKWLSNSLARNLIIGVVFVLIVSAIAVLAYMHNGWSFGDALYMTVLTVYTVGYGEVHPLNTLELRAITISARLHRHDLPHRRAGPVHHAFPNPTNAGIDPHEQANR